MYQSIFKAFVFFILLGAEMAIRAEEQAPQQPLPIDKPHYDPPTPSVYPPRFEEIDHVAEREPAEFQTKFLKMLGLLGLLIGGMYLASWSIKRMTKTRISQQNTDSAIKVVETRVLSHRTTLYLLDIEGKGFVIAESPGGVTRLLDVDLLK